MWESRPVEEEASCYFFVKPLQCWGGAKKMHEMHLYTFPLHLLFYLSLNHSTLHVAVDCPSSIQRLSRPFPPVLLGSPRRKDSHHMPFLPREMNARKTTTPALFRSSKSAASGLKYPIKKTMTRVRGVVFLLFLLYVLVGRFHGLGLG